MQRLLRITKKTLRTEITMKNLTKIKAELSHKWTEMESNPFKSKNNDL